jgi:hypothetical protein
VECVWRSRQHVLAKSLLPSITREELEANEEAWLNSGESGEYGSCSYFICTHYTDNEKAALWEERRDKRATGRASLAEHLPARRLHAERSAKLRAVACRIRAVQNLRVESSGSCVTLITAQTNRREYSCNHS